MDLIQANLRYLY
jgi:hypothetical protein